MKTLRAWYVAYGVGGPVLFVTQPQFAKTLVAQGIVELVGTLFLLGVLFQVLIALINKWVNWGNYYYESDETHPRGKIYSFCQFMGRQGWLDIAADLATLVAFGWATLFVLSAVSKSAGAA